MATGRLDGVFAGVAGADGWKPWDYCAGMVIALETGCAMEAIDQTNKGEEFDIYSDSVICATNPDLLEELRNAITATR